MMNSGYAFSTHNPKHIYFATFVCDGSKHHHYIHKLEGYSLHKS